jgi:hypothetical protein
VSCFGAGLAGRADQFIVEVARIVVLPIYFHLTHGDFLQHRGLTLVCILSIVIAPAETHPWFPFLPSWKNFSKLHPTTCKFVANSRDSFAGTLARMRTLYLSLYSSAIGYILKTLEDFSLCQKIFYPDLVRIHAGLMRNQPAILCRNCVAGNTSCGKSSLRNSTNLPHSGARRINCSSPASS